MAELVFLTPYQVGKILSGVIPANKVKRPNWLQTFFGQSFTTERETVNYDVEFTQKNTMGEFVSPTVDAGLVQLNDFGTRQLTFSYAKEGLASPDYEEINVRQLGQPFGEVDPWANEILNVQAKLALAEQRFENLREWIAAQIIFTGKYSTVISTDAAAVRKHPVVEYDFGRVVCTTEAELNDDLVPAIDLTAISISGGSKGDRSWTKALVAAGKATPVKDLVKMYETAKFRAGTDACIMSADAYEVFNYDVEENYSDSANQITAVLLRAERDILPRIKDVQGLTLKRSWPLGNGEYVDIYVYDAFYNDRYSGARTKYVPDGYVALIPPKENGATVYGRIIHPRAQYAAMPRWLNFWMNEKTGKREWEVHTRFVMAHLDINSLVCWKVK